MSVSSDLPPCSQSCSPVSIHHLPCSPPEQAPLGVVHQIKSNQIKSNQIKSSGSRSDPAADSIRPSPSSPIHRLGTTQPPNHPHHTAILILRIPRKCSGGGSTTFGTPLKRFVCGCRLQMLNKRASEGFEEAEKRRSEEAKLQKLPTVLVCLRSPHLTSPPFLSSHSHIV